MARACTICTHPDRTAIEVAIQSQHFSRVAIQFHVSKAALHRHVKAHVLPTPSPSSPDRARVERKDRITHRVQGQKIPADVHPDMQDAFLDQLVLVASISAACIAVGINRNTVRYWQEHDDYFALRYQDANQKIDDAFRSEIYRRGVTGYSEQVVTMKGDVVAVTKYSDRMLEFGAKARMSEYRDKLDVTSNGNTIANYDALASRIFNHAAAKDTHTQLSESADSRHGLDNTSGISSDSE